MTAFVIQSSHWWPLSFCLGGLGTCNSFGKGVWNLSWSFVCLAHTQFLLSLFMFWLGYVFCRDCAVRALLTKLFLGAVTRHPTDLFYASRSSVWNCIIEDSVISPVPLPYRLTFSKFIFSWGLIYIQWNSQILSIQFEFWKIYTSMGPPPQSRFRTFPLLQKVPFCLFLVNLCPSAHPR